MMCEHEWDNKYTESNCLICKKCKMCYCQAHEIELEQQLSAANVRVEELEQQNKRMRKALEWYVTHEVFFMQPEYDYEAKVGCTHVAKAALEETND